MSVQETLARPLKTMEHKEAYFRLPVLFVTVWRLSLCPCCFQQCCASTDIVTLLNFFFYFSQLCSVVACSVANPLSLTLAVQLLLVRKLLVLYFHRHLVFSDSVDIVNECPTDTFLVCVLQQVKLSSFVQF